MPFPAQSPASAGPERKVAESSDCQQESYDRRKPANAFNGQENCAHFDLVGDPKAKPTRCHLDLKRKLR
jgi:hypothetical protein